MAEFNLPFGVRIANSDPVDYDRYIAADIAARNAIVTAGRHYEGLQVWVESEQLLYVLKDTAPVTWEIIGGETYLKETSIGSGFEWNSGLLDVSVAAAGGGDVQWADGSVGTAARETSLANIGCRR